MRGLTSHVDWNAKIWETEYEEKVYRVPVGRKNIGSIFSLRSRWKQLTCSITQKRVMRMSDMVIDGWIGKQDKRAPNLWGGTAGSNGIRSRSLNGCLPSAPVRLATQRQPPGQAQHNVEAERCCRSQRAIPPQKLGNPGARALGAAGWLGTADRRRVGGAAQRNSRPLGRGDQQWPTVGGGERPGPHAVEQQPGQQRRHEAAAAAGEVQRPSQAGAYPSTAFGKRLAHSLPSPGLAQRPLILSCFFKISQV